MKLMTKSAVALLATTALAQAGGVERSNQSVAILFEEGAYAELSFSHVSPSVSGTLGVDSGDISPSYNNYALRYRQDITEDLSFALILDNHIGADVSYPTGTGYLFAGSTAELTGNAVTALLRYELPSNVSVYGGLRASQVDANVSLAIAPGTTYQLDVPSDTALGYVLGVAYEMPEIALRVSLTYNSAIDHTLEGTESGNATVPGTNNFDTTIPQSLHLEAQSGIAEDTLAFGSIRWVDWTEFEVQPVGYAAGLGLVNPLVGFRADTITYTVGIARRFTDDFAGIASIVYEPENNEITGNLGPTDGRIGLGLAGNYTFGNGAELTAGIQYSVIGNANTTVGASFSDNDSLAAGITIGTSF